VNIANYQPGAATELAARRDGVPSETKTPGTVPGVR